MKEKIKSIILGLILYSLIAGIAVGVFELYIGHRLILEPLLYNKDPNFVYESYFAPTYYGLTKSIIASIVFFLVYLTMPKTKFKPAIVGILGAIVFGLYYYFTFPPASFYSDILIGIVHFSFIAGVSYLAAKIFRI